MRTLLVFAALLGATTAFGDEWQKRFEVTGRPELRVDAQDAHVVLRPGAKNVIVARLTTHGWNIGPGGIRVHERQVENRVEIEIREPHLHWNFFSNRWSRLEIEVPRELRADVHTGDGRVEANGLAGELRLSTGDGSVEAFSVEGALDARTGDGSIRVQGRFERLDLNTGDGSVNAAVISGSKMVGPWRIHTGDGGVHLRLASDVAANLEAHTGDGGLHVDLPGFTTSGRHGNTISGRLNGGGSTLRVETGDGSIQVTGL